MEPGQKLRVIAALAEITSPVGSKPALREDAGTRAQTVSKERVALGQRIQQ